jgi:hypothetical protein
MYTRMYILHVEHVKNVYTIYTGPLSLRDNQGQSHIATDGRSVSLGVEPHLGLMTRYLLLFDSYGLVIVGRSV